MPRNRGIIIAVLVFPLLIWTVDSATCLISTGSQGFWSHWLKPDPMELKARLLLVFLISLGAGMGILVWNRVFSSRASTRKELLDSRERLQLALEATQDGVWDWDIPSGQMVYNDTWAKMLGIELTDLKTDESTWLSLIHPEDHARSNILFQAHLQGESPQYESEVRLRHKKGHYIWVLDRGRVVSRDEQGNPVRMTGTHRDITARKEAELALEVRNRIAEIFLLEDDQGKYQLLLETIVLGSNCGSGFFATLDEDKDLRVWAVYPPRKLLEGMPASLRIVADEIPSFLRPVIDQQQSLFLDHPQLVGPLGMEFKAALVVPVTNREKVIGVIFLGDKIQGFHEADRSTLESLAGFMAPILQSHLTSEMRELQMLQAQKMEALGALAGGIAHDFNNILQAIMGFTTLARDEAPQDSLIASDLEKVMKASRRGQDLVQRILLFSRREEQEYQTVSIYDIASEAVELIAPSVPATIKFRSELDENSGFIWADPSQINQIILNLATNAFQAMEKTGGTMEIGLRLIATPENGMNLPESLQNQQVVMLWISDSGCGIEPDVLDRIFDPFYTTKEVGSGTGLGLSVVHGIVTNHGGEIQFDSKPNQGTTVRVFLPSWVQEISTWEKENQCSTMVAQDTHLLQDTHILFIDDDEDITILGQAILEKCGFQVTALSNSLEALELIRQNPEQYDLVVTDLTMPHLTGLDLAEALGKVRNDLPVILITGLGSGESIQWDDHPNIQGLVHKPFDMNTLCQTIHHVLGKTT